MKKGLSTKKVLAIVSQVAKGHKLHDTAKKFGVSLTSVDKIVRGVSHSDRTGLSVGTKSSGTRFIRANAKQFIGMYNDYIGSKKSSEPVKATVTTSPDGEVSVATIPEVQKRLANIVNESQGIVSVLNENINKLDSHLSDLTSQRESLIAQRDHWSSVTTVFSAQ